MKLKGQNKSADTPNLPVLIGLPDGTKTKEGPIGLKPTSDDLMEAAKGNFAKDEPVIDDAPPVGEPVDAEFTVKDERVVSDEEATSNEVLKAEQVEDPPKRHNLDACFDERQSPDVEFVNWQINLKEDLQKAGAAVKQWAADANGHFANSMAKLRSPKWRIQQTRRLRLWIGDTASNVYNSPRNFLTKLFHSAMEEIFDTFHESMDAKHEETQAELRRIKKWMKQVDQQLRKAGKSVAQEDTPPTITQDQVKLLIDAVATGKMGNAAMIYRNLFGVTLGEAKNAVEVRLAA